MASPLISAILAVMHDSSWPAGPAAPHAPPVAVLWDESLLWGIMLFRALSFLGVPFRMVKAAEIEEDLLGSDPPKVLMVPGGFASSKARALGPRGIKAVQTFVRCGGDYVGFCGGAGLALSPQAEPGGLGLCPWKRKPMPDRLPNFSGHIGLTLQPGSLLEPTGAGTAIQAPVWWPSQFQPGNGHLVRVVARYGPPCSDFWVADLPAGDMTRDELTWWEGVYGINLNPELILNDPCILQGRCGQGRFLLSYAHLESPNSPQANACLVQILAPYLETACQAVPVPEWSLQGTVPAWDAPVLTSIRQILDEVATLGQSHFLLCWRSPWLLGWKRGIPGFALNTLLALVNQILELPPSEGTTSLLRHRAGTIMAMARQFQDMISTYLAEEKKLALRRKGAPASTGADELQRLRQDLVGPFPGQGGLYGRMAQELDQLLWTQLPGHCEQGWTERLHG